MTRLNSRSRFGCAQRTSAQRGFTFVELLVVIFLFVVLGTFVVSCARRGHGDNSRVRCASNLRQIGQAILLYSNDQLNGAFPRTRTSAGPDRVPTWGTNPAATQPFAEDGPNENDVTAAMFLLLRTQDITSEVFTCPSSDAEKDTYGAVDKAPIDRSNFTDVKKNLSYSYQNPYASDSAVKAGWHLDNKLGAEYAVAADTCGGTGEKALALTSTSSAKDMRQANSPNHDRDGQNILYGDGHVAWESNPFVGANRDNIYTTSDGKIVASPVDGNDSILLPPGE